MDILTTSNSTKIIQAARDRNRWLPILGKHFGESKPTDKRMKSAKGYYARLDGDDFFDDGVDSSIEIVVDPNWKTYIVARCFHGQDRATFDAKYIRGRI